MKKYFMIKEFAKLRKVHINSLLYYEKLGLLKPVYVNPQNNYRYYTAEQLPVLDTIIMCVKLGIPLKKMRDYIDKEGNLDFQSLLDYGSLLAKQQMEEIQSNMRLIERSLDLMADKKVKAKKNGIYNRKIRERHIIISEFFNTPGDIYVVVSEVAKFYEKAQQNGFTPLLPAGIILHYISSEKIRYCIFLEIISPNANNAQVITIPEGEYSCVQIEISDTVKPVWEVEKYWKWEENMTVLVQNMYFNKYNFNSKPGEFQKIQIDLK